MVFNATFNNCSAISWRSVFLVEETRVPRETKPTCMVLESLSYLDSFHQSVFGDGTCRWVFCGFFLLHCNQCFLQQLTSSMIILNRGGFGPSITLTTPLSIEVLVPIEATEGRVFVS